MRAAPAVELTLRRASDDQARNYEAAADELHRTASQQQLLCTVLRQQLREATEQRQPDRFAPDSGGVAHCSCSRAW